MRVIARQSHNGQACLDYASLVGSWRNTDSRASGLRRLSLNSSGGSVRLRVFGAGRPEPYDWGEVEARGYTATPTSWTAWAFTASYDTGLRSMHISAYIRAGLLVVTTYNAFSGAWWPPPYWTREFFHRENGGEAPTPASGGEAPGGAVPGGEVPGGEVPGGAVPGGAVPGGEVLGGEVPGGEPPVGGAADGATAPLLPWQLDPGPLVATWRNVDPAAMRLSRVRIGERSGYLVVRPYGVWTPRRHDWHDTVGSCFAEDIRTNVAVAFTTFFQLAVGEVEMVGYLDRRLLTIETASTFRDGSGRAPHFVREHFYPIEGQA